MIPSLLNSILNYRVYTKSILISLPACAALFYILFKNFINFAWELLTHEQTLAYQFLCHTHMYYFNIYICGCVCCMCVGNICHKLPGVASQLRMLLFARALNYLTSPPSFPFPSWNKNALALLKFLLFFWLIPAFFFAPAFCSAVFGCLYAGQTITHSVWHQFSINLSICAHTHRHVHPLRHAQEHITYIFYTVRFDSSWFAYE